MVLPLPRYDYIVTRSRPYPLKVLAVSGWRLGTQAECFASIHSVLDAVIDSVLCEEHQRSARAHFPAFFAAILASISFCNSFVRC